MLRTGGSSYRSARRPARVKVGSLVPIQIYRGDLHLLDGDLTAGGIQEYVDLILVAFPLHFQHHGDAGYGKGPQPRLGIVHGHPGGTRKIKRVIELPKRLRKGTLPVNRREPSTKASGFCRQARHTASMSAGRCWPSASTVTTPSWVGNGRRCIRKRLDGPALPSVFRMPQQDRRRGKLGKYRLGRRGTAIVHHHQGILPLQQTLRQGQKLFIWFVGRYQCDHSRIPSYT